MEPRFTPLEIGMSDDLFWIWDNKVDGFVKSSEKGRPLEYKTRQEVDAACSEMNLLDKTDTSLD